LIRRPNVKFGMAFKGITKAKESKSEANCMLVCLIPWVLFTKSGYLLNRYHFTEIRERLKNRVMGVRTNMAKNWILHHDNAPAHVVLPVAQFLTFKCITVMPRPPYSPDLAPGDFLFKKVKSAMKEHHFEATGHLEGCNAGLKRLPTSCTPGMLQAMAALLEKVCASTRDVL